VLARALVPHVGLIESKDRLVVDEARSPDVLRDGVQMVNAHSIVVVVVDTHYLEYRW